MRRASRNLVGAYSRGRYSQADWAAASVRGGGGFSPLAGAAGELSPKGEWPGDGFQANG